MAKAEFIEYVEGLGDVYRVYANFVKQILTLNKVGINTPVSVRDASYIRLHGKNSEYTRTCHAPIYARDSPVIIARMSPLVENLEMANQVIEAHRDNKYHVFDKSVYVQWEKIAKRDKRKKPEKRRAIILPERKDFRVHIDSDEARFFWEDTRKNYFKKKVSGDSVPCWQIPTDEVDSIDGAIVNYVGFLEPADGSDLSFRYRSLYNDDWALGVLEKSAEGTSPKILSHTPKDLRQAKEELKRLSQILQPEQLKYITGLVAKLKQ